MKQKMVNELDYFGNRAISAFSHKVRLVGFGGMTIDLVNSTNHGAMANFTAICANSSFSVVIGNLVSMPLGMNLTCIMSGKAFRENPPVITLARFLR